MTKINLYSTKGVKSPNGVNLPKELEEKKNMRLLSQALRVYEDNRHFGLSKTKTRSEIDLTKKKAYRQKGTGMARHGAKSAPIFVGGSKAHGPKGVKRELVLPRKMRQKALAVALGVRIKEKQVVAVSNIGSLKKTKEVADFVKKIAVKEEGFSKNSKKTFLLSQKNKDFARVLSNLGDTKVLMFSDTNAYNVHLGGFLLIDNEVFGELKGKNAKGALDGQQDKGKPSVKKKVSAKTKKTTKK